MNRTNHQWRIAARPQGDIKPSDFSWHEEPVPELADGQVLIRSIWLSLDPTNRVWMNEARSYLPSIPLGSVMRGSAIGVVEESKSGKFQKGDIVMGLLGWQEYLVSDGTGIAKMPAIPLPLSAHFGLLGHIGYTAYFGLIDVGKAKAGETLVVSAAAGAVGSIAGQIGKILGMRVVGIAGSDAKCDWLKKDLGFDAAINYKTADLAKALREACKSGVDVYFENVGGAILEAVLSQINLRARIAVCGMISTYNSSQPAPGPRNLGLLIQQRARMEGFLVMDYAQRFPEAAGQLIDWHQAGRLKYKLDVVNGLENAPQALTRLFDGSNQGKLLVGVSPEPAAVGGGA